MSGLRQGGRGFKHHDFERILNVILLTLLTIFGAGAIVLEIARIAEMIAMQGLELTAIVAEHFSRHVITVRIRIYFLPVCRFYRNLEKIYKISLVGICFHELFLKYL